MKKKSIKKIILISIDDLRFDAISCERNKVYLEKYGLANLPHTPNLDFFAKNGIRFSQAITVAPYTPPPHASMFTSLYPPKHGVRAFLKSSLSRAIPMINSILEQMGYTVIHAIDFYEMFEIAGLTRDINFLIRSNDRKLFKLLSKNMDNKIFIFVHFTDVHPPYGKSNCPPHEDYNKDFYTELEGLANDFKIPFDIRDDKGCVSDKKIIDLSNKIRIYCEERKIAATIQFPRYLRGVNKFDRGRFDYFMDSLKKLGLLEDCFLVITSDHGQGPMEDMHMANKTIPQKFDHGETVREELIRVPLIFYSPDIFPKPKEIKDQVSIIDITPTILDYAGVDLIKMNSFQGKSLRKVINGEEESGSDAYAEVWYHNRAKFSRFLSKCRKEGRIIPSGYETFLYQKAVRTPKYKLVETFNKLTDKQSKSLALYDLENDPFEDNNILDIEKANRTVNNLKKIMKKIEKDSIEANVILEAKSQEDTDRVIERLKSLGYID